MISLSARDVVQSKYRADVCIK